MTNTEKLITDQLKSVMAIDGKNQSSFNKSRNTVSNLINKGKGEFRSFCSMCDDLGLEVVLMKR